MCSWYTVVTCLCTILLWRKNSRIMCAFWQPLKQTTGGSDMFKAVTNYGCHFSRYFAGQIVSASVQTEQQQQLLTGQKLNWGKLLVTSALYSIAPFSVTRQNYVVWCKWPWKFRHCAALIHSIMWGNSGNILPVLHSERAWLLRGKGLDQVVDLKEVVRLL